MRRESIGSIVRYCFEGLETRGVLHAFITRLGGVSAPPFATLNLGHTVGDNLMAVEENHRRAFATLGLRREQVVSPYQVHGTQVRPVFRIHGGSVLPATDGLLTATPGVALLLRFADCAPLLLFDPLHRAVGLVHAGWKGAAGHITAAAVTAFARYVGSRPQDLWAGIGPAIGPCCYAIKPETGAVIAQAIPAAVEVLQRRNGVLYLDLPGLVRAQLAAAGVQQIEMANLCTACHTDEWFSHRAEHGRTGRFGVVAMLQ